MSAWVAFLRGVNLGKRQMKMAELKAACEAMGLTEVKTILASGNVRFETTRDTGLKARLETQLEKSFSFPVKVVLRRREEVEAMLASEPFARLDPKADAKCFALLVDPPMKPLPKIADAPGDWEVARIDADAIYLIGYRRPNGRYSEGFAALDPQLPKGLLTTMRTWGTIEKVVA